MCCGPRSRARRTSCRSRPKTSAGSATGSKTRCGISCSPTRSVPAAGAEGTANGNVEQIPTAILTLAVTQQEAEKIIYAQGKANPATYTGLYLALMNAKSKVVAGAPGVDGANLFR